MKRKARCIIMNCKNPILSRGLCCTHYWRAKAKVDRGETSWFEEEKKGAAKAPYRGIAGYVARHIQRPDPQIRAHVEAVTSAVHRHGSNKTCLVPGCTNDATTRGLCGKDYAIANSLVKKGQTSWKKLVGAGKAEASFLEISPAQRAKDFFLAK